MAQITFNEVLEAIDHLPVDQQADVIEIVRRRLAEIGRRQIVEDAKEGRAAFDAGQTKPASVDDLIREITE